MSLSNPSSEPRILCRRGGRLNVNDKGGGWLQGNCVCPILQDWNAHKLTETLTAFPSPRLCSNQKKILALRREKGYKFLHMNKKLFGTTTCWDRGIQFCLEEGQCIYHHANKACPMHRSSRPTQKDSTSISFVIYIYILVTLFFDFHSLVFAFCFWERGREGKVRKRKREKLVTRIWVSSCKYEHKNYG